MDCRFGSKSVNSFGSEKLIDPFLESLAVNLYPPTNVEQAIRFVDFRSYLQELFCRKWTEWLCRYH